MAISLNRAQILGNVTRDIELRSTPSGQSVTSFGVATNRRYKNRDGEFVEDVQFHEVVVWGKLAEIVSQILRKGSKVYVEGRLQTRTWEAQDGSRRKSTEIVMENFVPLTPKGAPAEELAEEVVTEPAVPPATPKVAEEPKEKAKKTDNTKSAKEEKADEKPADESLEKKEEINLDDIPF